MKRNFELYLPGQNPTAFKAHHFRINEAGVLLLTDENLSAFAAWAPGYWESICELEGDPEESNFSSDEDAG